RSEDAADRALLADVTAAARRWNESGRAPDLLWRGEALVELGRLAARSAALTEVERAFAHDSARARQRARRLRRGIVAAVMIVLAGVASVMAYLSVVANENRAEAERNATRAAESAKLAEDTLTTSLIAQGRRELNDDRALPALAYFAAAMRRGADSQGLRAMVSIASRGWKDVITTSRDAPFSTVTGSPNGWIAAGDHIGSVRYWDDSGALLGVIKPEIGPIAMVKRQPDDTLLVVGDTGTVHLGTRREELRRIPTKDVWYAHFGPGADELTGLGHGMLRVFGFDGKVRRELELDPAANGMEPTFGPQGRHVLMPHGDGIASVDLVTMKRTVIAEAGWGSQSAQHGAPIYAYVDPERRVHMIEVSGKPIKTIETTTRPMGIVISEDHTRLGIAGDTEMSIYDIKGNRLGGFAIEREQSVFLLRGDEAWIAGPQGVLRHYQAGDLVASVPATLTEVQLGTIGKTVVALMGSDASLVLVRAATQQVTYDKDVCPKPQYSSNGIATGYGCGDKVRLFMGRQFIGEYPAAEMELQVTHHAPSGRSAVTGGAGIHVFDRDGKVVAKSDRRGPTAFEDAGHLWVGAEQKGLWRWTIGTEAWEEILPAANVYAIAVVPGKIVLGTREGHVIVVENRREVKRLEVGEQVGDMVSSPDGRWLAVHLATGATTIVDTRTWQITRTMAPADNYGAAPTFDASGDLLLRSSRNALAIWDRATGEELVHGLDLLQNLNNGRFLPDGRIEMNRRQPGLLDIPRDTRPIAQILRDIDCKVPLKVVGSRIEPHIPTCP
ncbi:MAG TPA: hypothetical protein VIV11_41540, partial [Kofleriaceae bacterium]